jgi:hypothetical protein
VKKEYYVSCISRFLRYVCEACYKTKGNDISYRQKSL